MVQICMFGGYDGRLRPEKKIYFTAFGTADLVRPTLARRVLWAREQQRRGGKTIQRYLVITVFGATDIVSPTLAEEYIDLKAMVDAGQLSLTDWDRAITDVHRFEEESITSLTLFGGLGETELPEEDKEIESLALQLHLGSIPGPVGEVLQLGVGQCGAQREAVVYRAATVAA